MSTYEFAKNQNGNYGLNKIPFLDAELWNFSELGIGELVYAIVAIADFVYLEDYKMYGHPVSDKLVSEEAFDQIEASQSLFGYIDNLLMNVEDRVWVEDLGRYVYFGIARSLYIAMLHDWVVSFPKPSEGMKSNIKAAAINLKGFDFSEVDRIQKELFFDLVSKLD